MKYALLFVTSEDDAEAFENLNQAGREAMYGRIGEWAQKHEAHLGFGAQLQGPETATTVRFASQHDRDKAPMISDGPFIEGKEIIGGIWMLEAQNHDEAVRIAKEWPATSMVELRPIVERTS